MLKRRLTMLLAALATATLSFPAAASAADPVIAAAGDIACDPGDTGYNSGAGTSTRCRQQYTSDLLVGGGFDAVLPLGDIQYEDGTLVKYQAVYDPTWGQVNSIAHPVPGNHEYPSSSYFTYFGASAGDPAKGYYSYDVGQWHLIALNSNCDFVSCAAGSAQELWLAADLAANQNKCVLAYWHHPLFNSSPGVTNETRMTPIWQDLYAAHADVVLNGHAHDYERFAPQDPTGAADAAHGIREFVVGTGGKSHSSSVSPAAANSEVRNNDTFGVLKLTLRAYSYDWEFVREAGGTGTLTDSGSQSCHRGPSIAAPANNSHNNTGTVALSGTAQSNATITVYDGAASQGTTTSDGAGSWAKTLSSVADGSHSYTATATDAASQTSEPSAAVNVTVDTAAPAAPAITSPAGNSYNNTGTVALTGTAEPNTTITVYDDATSQGTTTADGSGNWSKTLNSVADGAHGYTATATDAAANDSPASSAVNVTVDSAAPAAPSITSPANNSYNNTGTVALSGTAEPNTTITVYDDATSQGTTTADGSGNWSKTLNSVADGAHVYTAIATDAATNTSPNSTVITITVDKGPPSSSVESSQSSSSTTIVVSYSAADNSGGSGLASVELWVKRPGDAGYSRAATDSAPASAGSFSYKASSGDGTYSFYAIAADRAGNREPAPANPDATTRLDTAAPPPAGEGGATNGGSTGQTNPPPLVPTPPFLTPNAVTAWSIPRSQMIGRGRVVGYLTLGRGGSLVEGKVLVRGTAGRLLAMQSAVIARSVSRSTRAGAFRVVVKFSARMKKRLRRLRRIRVTLRIVVTPSTGTPFVISRAVMLRR